MVLKVFNAHSPDISDPVSLLRGNLALAFSCNIHPFLESTCYNQPRRIAILSSLAGLSASETPRAMAARASSPGRATQAKQVKGYKSDKAQSNGPSVWRVGHKASNPVPLNTHVTERATKKINTTGRDGLSELSKDTRMNDSGQSRKEMVDRKMEALGAKWKTRI